MEKNFCCRTGTSCCNDRCPSSESKLPDKLTEACPLKDSKSECKLECTRRLGALLICLILLLLAIVGVLLLNFLFARTGPAAVPANTDIVLAPVPKTVAAKPHGAVATDHVDCSHIGAVLLRQGGNAVDAAVAAAVCISVVAPHKTGLGGGGRMMIYSHRDGTNPLLVDFANNTNEGIFATAKVRVPGFLRGLEFAQSLRGNLPWRRIVEPSVKIARDGFIVSEGLAEEIGRSVEHGMIWGHLRSGDNLRLPVLADTLEAVARFGCDVLYNGSLSEKVLRDAVVRDELLHQLSNYEPRVSVSEKTIFHDHAIYLPSGATIFRSSFEDLEELRIPASNSSSLETQIVAALSIVRSVAGNIELLKNLERERYSNIVAMDPHDIYVSIVTGLSTPLGLAHMTGAGFLLDGVDTGNSLDSLTPIILHDDKSICGLRGVFGTDDPTLAAQIIYNLVLRNFNVSTAIEYPRFHVFSDGIVTESDDRHSMDPTLRAQLNSLVPASRVDVKKSPKSVNAITKHEETLASHSDSRGDGRASRF